ncbi:MAG: hypothetical protein ACREFN_13255 [Acetobacteraceae bacterium]
MRARAYDAHTENASHPSHASQPGWVNRRPVPVPPGSALLVPVMTDARQVADTHGRAREAAALGDWWAFGEARYGERKAVVEAEDWDGPAYQTCRNSAAVCTAFPEMSRRRDNLSFSHHAEVAALPAAEADALAEAAKRADLPDSEVRRLPHPPYIACNALKT